MFNPDMSKEEKKTQEELEYRRTMTEAIRQNAIFILREGD